MSDTYTHCPKCGHTFPHPLPGKATCPACGIYLFKWQSSPTASVIYDTEPDNAQHWGALAHTLGGLLMFAALAWASAVLWRQREKLSQSPGID